MALRKVDFAAKELNVSEQRVYELVRQGYIPRGVVIPLGKRQIRFNEEAFRDWIAHGGDITSAGIEKVDA